MLCLKEYPHDLSKYEINGTLKIPIPQLFSELGKIWKCSQGKCSQVQPIQKKINFYELVKTEKSIDRATLKTPKTSFWIWKNLKIQSKTNTHKIPNLNLWMNWEKLSPNLSFTVENKAGNL